MMQMITIDSEIFVLDSGSFIETMEIQMGYFKTLQLVVWSQFSSISLMV